jgi:hypothetical protein
MKTNYRNITRHTEHRAARIHTQSEDLSQPFHADYPVYIFCKANAARKYLSNETKSNVHGSNPICSSGVITGDGQKVA